MSTTDTLLIVTILLLLCATGVNLKGGTKTCPLPCPTYIPRPCKENFSDHHREGMFGMAGMTLEDSFSDIEEMTNHTRGRGLIPTITQPQHTRNLWKPQLTQPDYDSAGRRMTYFSSDLLTPYKDQYKLRNVDPSLKKVKIPHMNSSHVENFSVYPYDNPLQNEPSFGKERNPYVIY